MWTVSETQEGYGISPNHFLKHVLQFPFNNLEGEVLTKTYRAQSSLQVPHLSTLVCDWGQGKHWLGADKTGAEWRRSSLHYGPLQEFPPKLKTPHQDLCSLKIIFVQRLYFHRFTKYIYGEWCWNAVMTLIPLADIKELSDSPCAEMQNEKSLHLFLEKFHWCSETVTRSVKFSLLCIFSWHREGFGTLEVEPIYTFWGLTMDILSLQEY